MTESLDRAGRAVEPRWLTTVIRCDDASRRDGIVVHGGSMTTHRQALLVSSVILVTGCQVLPDQAARTVDAATLAPSLLVSERGGSESCAPLSPASNYESVSAWEISGSLRSAVTERTAIGSVGFPVEVDGTAFDVGSIPLPFSISLGGDGEPFETGCETDVAFLNAEPFESVSHLVFQLPDTDEYCLIRAGRFNGTETECEAQGPVETWLDAYR
jgi:hypothetical protein